MSNNESKAKMVVPCDVAIRRFYRMYVTVGEDAGKQEIEDAVHGELLAAYDQDDILTPDPDLDIETHDVLEINPDADGAWWEGADGPFADVTSKDAERESKMRRIARGAMNMLRLARPERKLTVAYIKPNEKDIERYTEWQRRSKGIVTGDEYFLVWDCEPYEEPPRLLYAVNVTADSLLTAAGELFGLLGRKF